MKTSPAATVIEWLNRLHAQKYTGRTTLHWVDGVPKKVEYPGPIQTLPLVPTLGPHPIDQKSD